MKTIKLLFLSALLVTTNYVSSQEIAIGEWRDNLPYSQAIDITEVGEKIYCATPYSLFSYNKEDNHLKKISKISGLSDVGISKIQYNEEKEMLIVLYNNSNIDLITKDELINIPDIKIAPITGTKAINNITFNNNFAYLATGFGIVVIDLDKKEVKETYYIGQNSTQINVNDVAIGNDTIYAATKNWIYKAALDAPNLLNFEYWNIDTSITSEEDLNFIKFFHGRLYISKRCLVLNNDSTDYVTRDSLFTRINNQWSYINLSHGGGIYDIKIHNDKILIAKWGYIGMINSNHQLAYSNWIGALRPASFLIDKDGQYWIAETSRGLVKFDDEDEENYSSYAPNGPASIYAFTATSYENKIIVAEGGYNSSDWSQKYRRGRINWFVNGEWSSKDLRTSHEISDISSAAIDPYDNAHVFLSSYKDGIIELIGDSVQQIYTEPEFPFTKISYTTFDKNGDLWIAAWNKLYKMDRSKNYTSISFSDVISGWCVPNKIIFDENNNPWTIFTRNEINKIIAFDGTKNHVVTISSEFGNVKTFAFDLDGELWIGSNKGISVVYSPEGVFSNSTQAERIIIEQDGYAQYLLETEVITDIEIDGANRKWIGTGTSGVYLVSEDGQNEIFHFTKENSALPSNNIDEIVINHENGEVFFGTDNGMVSFKNDATKGDITHADKVYAYPNPVKSNYNGPIAIKGLVRDADVTITDVAGNLVFRTTALGGQAIWNGKNLNGEDAATGVYLVFSTNEDGSDKMVTKILLTN